MPLPSQGEALAPESASSSGRLPEESGPSPDGQPTLCCPSFSPAQSKEEGDLPVLRSLESSGVRVIFGSSRSETGAGNLLNYFYFVSPRADLRWTRELRDGQISGEFRAH